MDFNWRSPIFTRLAILAASVFVLGYSLGDKFNFALSLIFILAVAFQLFQLVNLFENKLPDRTDQPKPKPMTEAPAKPDDIALFFRNIVQHIGIGILTFNKEGKIQTVNAAAKRMLRIEKIDMLEELRAVDNLLVDSILRLKTGGRELVRLKLGAETLDLSLYAIELTLRGEPMKLISMSNIQSELEEKEMEAWRNLVRVLTHEIMNSVTPISSLAGVVEDELQSKITNQEFSLKDEELHDMHLSVQTIGKRSQGLIRFVKEFRNLTHVPQPKLAEVNVKDLLEEIVMLHKKISS